MSDTTKWTRQPVRIGKGMTAYVDRDGTVPARDCDPVGCVVSEDGKLWVAPSDPARPLRVGDRLEYDDIDDRLDQQREPTE